MMIGGTSARVTLQALVPGWGGSRASRGWHYFERVKVLHPGLCVLRSHLTYFEPTRANFFT